MTMPATVPTQEEFDALVRRVEALENPDLVAYGDAVYGVSVYGSRSA